MQIIRDLFDVQNIQENDVGVVSFYFKTSGQFHAGHEKLINDLKNISSKTAIYFFDHINIYHNLFNSVGKKVYTFDEEYCKTWCENLGINYMVIINSDIIQKVKTMFNFEQFMQHIDNIINSEKYDSYFLSTDSEPTRINNFKYALFTYKITTFLNIKFKRLLTWKEGILSYAQKAIYDKFEGPNFAYIVDPLRRPDGLIYSTRFLTLPQTTIDFYITIKNELDKFGSNLINIEELRMNLSMLCEGTKFEASITYCFENMFGFNKLIECCIRDNEVEKFYEMVEKY